MNHRKMIVIGWDGATFDIINPLIELGHMPVLSSMIKKGGSGNLVSTTPAVTPVAWTSMITGTNPGRHGIFDGHILDPESNRICFADSTKRCVPPLWTAINKAGLRTAMLNIPVTYPPEQVEGILVPGMFAPQGVSNAIFPPAFSSEFEKKFGPHTDSPPKYDDPHRYLESLLAGVEHRRKMIEYLMDMESWDFMFNVFMEADRVQHFFWEYRDKNHPLHEELGNSVEQIYIALDKALGKIMEKAGDNVCFAIVSDHGAGPLHTGVFLNRWLLDRGLLSLNEPVEEILRETNSIKNKLSNFSSRALAKIGMGNKQRKIDILNNLFRSAIDWKRTKAYSDGMGGGIYFNTEIINDKNRNDLTLNIFSGLMELRDPERNMPVIKEVHRREDIYEGNEIPKAPDLIIECTAGYQIYAPHEFILHRKGRPENLFVKHPWSGRHEQNGIFIMQGPGILKNNSFSSCAMQDVAPTLLSLMNVPIPAFMDGKIVAKGVETQVIEDTVYEKDEYFSSPSSEKSQKNNNSNIKKQLKDLGYM